MKYILLCYFDQPEMVYRNRTRFVYLSRRTLKHQQAVKEKTMCHQSGEPIILQLSAERMNERDQKIYPTPNCCLVSSIFVHHLRFLLNRVRGLYDHKLLLAQHSLWVQTILSFNENDMFVIVYCLFDCSRGGFIS